MLLKWAVFFFSYFVLLYTFLVLFFIPRFVCALVFRTVLVSCLSFFLVVSDALRFPHNIFFVCLSFFFYASRPSYREAVSRRRPSPSLP